jgi:hypothetical protein
VKPVLTLRVVSFALFAAIAAYSAHLAFSDTRYRYVLNTGNRLELGETVPAGVISAAAEMVVDPSFSSECRTDVLRPALTVILYHLNATNPALDYSGWSKAHGDADNFLKAMIQCMPSDSNAWFREAFVSRAIAEDAAKLCQKLAVARQLSPYEEPEVFTRLFLWKSLSPFALTKCESLARTDIRAVMLYGGKSLKNFLRINMSPAFEALVNSEAENLQPEG